MKVRRVRPPHARKPSAFSLGAAISSRPLQYSTVALSSGRLRSTSSPFDRHALPLFDLTPPLQRAWLVERLARPAPESAKGLSDGFRLPGREGEPTPAAVLVPLINRPEGLHVLLTQRSADLADHAGQISFLAAASSRTTKTTPPRRCVKQPKKSDLPPTASRCWASSPITRR